MTPEQLSYDIAEFVINNRDELRHSVNEDVAHLSHCERIFSSYPELFDELLEKARKDSLRTLLQDHFPEADNEIIRIAMDNLLDLL